MDPARWSRCEAIYVDALEHEPETREEFVKQSCDNDSELCAEVLSLLDSHLEAGDWLEQPAVLETQSEPFAGLRVGAYRIERELGHGGMGSVYLARRADDQYEKLVAVKVVRTELQGEFFAERFRRERQILATLEHPNIARLLDGGVTDDSRPFLVMEFVEGVPVDRYCESTALPIRDRLHLFRKICSAVNYAHQHLTIHRDLKPTNILVTKEGEPKLLDFGIARPIDGLTSEGTEILLATPVYASPELLRRRLVTTATDVYSLGIILYRLLKGSTPEGASTKWDMTSIPRDLRSIVLKTVSEHPEDRYASAELLSEDVRRHLDSLPVLAGNEPFFQAAVKFVRRNTIPVVAGIVATLALVAATIVSIQQGRRAAEERHLAEQRLESLRKLTGSVLFEIHDSIQTLPGATQARKLLAQSALQYLNSLDPASAREPKQRIQLIEAYRKVGDVQGNPTNANLGDTSGALVSYGKALAIAQDLLRSRPEDVTVRRSLATLLQKIADTEAQTGQVTNAVADSRRSMEMFVDLARHDRSLEAQQKAAIGHIKLGDLLGHPVFPNLKDRDGAMSQYREALAIFTGLQPVSDPTNRRYIGLLQERIGKMLEVQNRMEEAFDHYSKSFDIRQTLASEFPSNTNARRDLAIAHEKIGDLLIAKGRHREALVKYEDALKIFESLHTLDPSNANASRSLGIGYEKVADTLKRAGKQGAARQHYTKALDVHRQLASKDPLNTSTRSDVDRVVEKIAEP